MELLRNRTPCWYGMKCYRRQQEHFEKYSHPQGHPHASKMEQTIEMNFNYQQEKNQHHQQNQNLNQYHQQDQNQCYQQDENYEGLQEERNVAMHNQLLVLEQLLVEERKIAIQNQLLKQALEEKMKMPMDNQSLKQALGEEIDKRQRRKIDKQKILEIPRDTPNHWGINTFVQSYREIDICQDSPEFNIINGLINSTIVTHGNEYGTIYGQDATEYIVTNITRIHNDKLWHEYCFKKETIIRKNGNNLINCESSKYLKRCPLLTPLLEATANEYWLFHGCAKNVTSVLLHAGYDPRVSSLDGMFGGGFYLAENSSKSNQYIACTGCGKNAKGHETECNCQNQEQLEFSMILYRVILGDVHIAKNYNKNIYRGDGKNRVRRPPSKKDSNDLYDSVMGESTKYGGNILKYREFILYEPAQAYPEYVIKFRRSAANVRQPPDTKNILDQCYKFLRNK